MDNEKDRTWNRQMHSLIQEMIHYRNGLSESEEPDPQTVSEFEERYKTILSIAGDEYDYEPHGKYYRDGYLSLIHISASSYFWSILQMILAGHSTILITDSIILSALHTASVQSKRLRMSLVMVCYGLETSTTADLLWEKRLKKLR